MNKVVVYHHKVNGSIRGFSYPPTLIIFKDVNSYQFCKIKQ